MRFFFIKLKNSKNWPKQRLIRLRKLTGRNYSQYSAQFCIRGSLDRSEAVVTHTHINIHRVSEKLDWEIWQ